MVRGLDDLFKYYKGAGYVKQCCIWFLDILTAHGWQFKCGNTNFLFEQQEICLWHLSSALFSHEAVLYRFWEPESSSAKKRVTEILQFKDLKGGMFFMQNNLENTLQIFHGLYGIIPMLWLCLPKHLGWSPCCFEMCKDFVPSLTSVQFDLPTSALFLSSQS